jgi:hypothetical protein
MGADTDKIEFARGMTTKTVNDSPCFNVKENLPHLKAYMKKMRPKLMIVDPITEYMIRKSGDENLDIRSALTPLEQAAEKYKTTILLVTHTHKGVDTAAPALHQAIGSIAYGAVVRSAWMVMRSPDDNEHRLFLKAKLSIGIAKPGLSYRIKQVGNNPTHVRLIWDKETVKQSAEEMLCKHQNRGRPPRKRNNAEEIILKAFKNTDNIKSKKIKKQLEAANISYKTYMTVKKALGVKSVQIINKKTNKMHWSWKLEK